MFKYLQGTKDAGISYTDQSNIQKLRAFSDSDHAGDKKTRRSTTGYIIQYCGGLISWGAKLQDVTALSTEAEFIAAAECTCQMIYIKNLIEELIGKPVQTELNIDNQSAIRLMTVGIFNQRTRHIDVRYHFLDEKIRKNQISIKYVSSDDQLADIFTKPLGSVKFTKFRNLILS